MGSNPITGSNSIMGAWGSLVNPACVGSRSTAGSNPAAPTILSPLASGSGRGQSRGRATELTGRLSSSGRFDEQVFQWIVTVYNPRYTIGVERGLVARWHGKPEAAGSNPVTPTNFEIRCKHGQGFGCDGRVVMKHDRRSRETVRRHSSRVGSEW
jgi:hypothetical protein